MSLKHAHEYQHEHEFGNYKGRRVDLGHSKETPGGDIEHRRPRIYVERDRAANLLGWSGGKRRRTRKGGVSKKKKRNKRTSHRTNPKLGLRVGSDFVREPMIDVRSLCATLPRAAPLPKAAPQPFMSMGNLSAALPSIAAPAPVVIVPPAGLRIINPASLSAIQPQIIRPVARRPGRSRGRKKYTWSKKGGRRRKRRKKRTRRRRGGNGWITVSEAITEPLTEEGDRRRERRGREQANLLTNELSGKLVRITIYGDPDSRYMDRQVVGTIKEAQVYTAARSVWATGPADPGRNIDIFLWFDGDITSSGSLAKPDKVHIFTQPSPKLDRFGVLVTRPTAIVPLPVKIEVKKPPKSARKGARKGGRQRKRRKKRTRRKKRHRR